MMSFAHLLVKRGLLLTGTFTLTSGKISPYYIDLRKLPSFPEFSDVVAESAKILSKINFDYVVGIATGGVPLASFIACKLNKPLGYVRNEKKEHGTASLVEGVVNDKEVLLVDDVATTGKSLLSAINKIENSGGRVSSAFVIIDREEGALEKLKQRGVTLISLYKISNILKQLVTEKLVTDSEAISILKYLGDIIGQ
ncbi:orotate phosphoribosyltransferase [Sulfolobales archaeon HS-7]|nr:orotate phosphoribosyltransferase [Sulfolobales archaeon HS-7]